MKAKSAALALRVERREPLSLVVSRQIRELIVSGQVQDGTELPSEKELGQQLGVGRSTVREALRICQAQGLLSGGDSVSTQRPRVSSEQSMVIAADVMENVLRLGRVPIGDLVALRVLIEGAVVEEAASRETDLEAARQAVAVMSRRGVELAEFRAADLAFHQALAGAAGNTAYALVMGVLREAIAGHLGETLERVDDPRASMTRLAREHAEILDAVERGKPRKARELVTRHIEDFYPRASR